MFGAGFTTKRMAPHAAMALTAVAEARESATRDARLAKGFEIVGPPVFGGTNSAALAVRRGNAAAMSA